MLRATLRIMLETYAKNDGCNQRAAIRDFMTDLHHIAVEQGVNFQDVIEGSEAVYQEEMAMESQNRDITVAANDEIVKPKRRRFS